MSYKNIALAILVAAALPLRLCAQETTIQRKIPVYLELSAGMNTQGYHLKPFEGNLNLIYSLSRDFSIHAVSQNTYFMHKEGTSHKYNLANNIGGGIAYRFAPKNSDSYGNLEARAFVTTSINSGDFKNTAYNVGLYWYGSPKLYIAPVFGIGYSAKDFSAKGMKTHHSLYFTFGLRI